MTRKAVVVRKAVAESVGRAEGGGGEGDGGAPASEPAEKAGKAGESQNLLARALIGRDEAGSFCVQSCRESAPRIPEGSVLVEVAVTGDGSY